MDPGKIPSGVNLHKLKDDIIIDIQQIKTKRKKDRNIMLCKKTY